MVVDMPGIVSSHNMSHANKKRLQLDVVVGIGLNQKKSNTVRILTHHKVFRLVGHYIVGEENSSALVYFYIIFSTIHTFL